MNEQLFSMDEIFILQQCSHRFAVIVTPVSAVFGWLSGEHAQCDEVTLEVAQVSSTAVFMRPMVIRSSVLSLRTRVTIITVLVFSLAKTRSYDETCGGSLGDNAVSTR